MEHEDTQDVPKPPPGGKPRLRSFTQSRVDIDDIPFPDPGSDDDFLPVTGCAAPVRLPDEVEYPARAVGKLQLSRTGRTATQEYELYAVPGKPHVPEFFNLLVSRRDAPPELTPQSKLAKRLRHLGVRTDRIPKQAMTGRHATVTLFTVTKNFDGTPLPEAEWWSRVLNVRFDREAGQEG